MKIGHKLMIRKTLEPVEFRKAFKNGKVDVWHPDKGLLRMHYLELRLRCGRKQTGNDVRVRHAWVPSICKGCKQ